ncbi:MAG: hypothetical protein A2107_00675 [Verrucomicrobia bacterium GWF2_62_7]|nr:MAG: hypothetical protein A2107_00675 [Verrucomicrobia bacterium GWF2_62_7]
MDRLVQVMSSVYFPFAAIRSLDQGYVERLGPPDECTSALGYVTIGFNWLEESLERQIARLAGLSARIAPAMTSELSFKTKVAVLSSLVRMKPPLREFNVGKESPEDVWNDIVRMLFECEQLRNKVAHSRWSLPSGARIQRTKTTAKPARGVAVASEEFTSGHLLDIYDYVLNVQWMLDEFFL